MKNIPFLNTYRFFAIVLSVLFLYACNANDEEVCDCCTKKIQATVTICFEKGSDATENRDRWLVWLPDSSSRTNVVKFIVETPQGNDTILQPVISKNPADTTEYPKLTLFAIVAQLQQKKYVANRAAAYGNHAFVIFDSQSDKYKAVSNVRGF